ncbi:MAG TPA: hypothetical protein VGF59_16165 [Bryobacteraceae bacterium]|jgi:hypothetical protein
MSSNCSDCKELLNKAADATVRHLQAVGRMDLARLRHEDDLLPALRIVTDEARVTREKALAAYRRHRSAHAAAAAS